MGSIRYPNTLQKSTQPYRTDQLEPFLIRCWGKPYHITLLRETQFDYIADLIPFFTLLRYTLSCYIVEVYPVVFTLFSYSQSQSFNKVYPVLMYNLFKIIRTLGCYWVKYYSLLITCWQRFAKSDSNVKR